MEKVFKFNITKEDVGYSADCQDDFIVTEADSFDELIININEAVELYCEESDLQEYIKEGRAKVSINFEQPVAYVA